MKKKLSSHGPYFLAMLLFYWVVPLIIQFGLCSGHSSGPASFLQRNIPLILFLYTVAMPVFTAAIFALYFVRQRKCSLMLLCGGIVILLISTLIISHSPPFYYFGVGLEFELFTPRYLISFFYPSLIAMLLIELAGILLQIRRRKNAKQSNSPVQKRLT